MIVEYLVADTFGTHIGKYSQRLKITQHGETLSEAPLLHLRAIYIAERGVSISADVVAACSELGIPIHYMDSLGRNYASLYSSGLTGTVKTRRAQLAAYWTETGFRFVQALAEAKIHNQAATLKYLAKTRKESQTEVYQALHMTAGDLQDCIARILALRTAPIEEQRESLMGVEGYAAKLYWTAVRDIIPAEYGWKERGGRGSLDPVNSLLNYGYGILYSRVEQALTLAGLDPYAGFFHADRPGKPSLVLDLIEEFRQIAVDRVIWGLLNRHYKIEQMTDGRLHENTRRDYAEKILEHQNATFNYEGKKVPLRIILQSQARKAASFFRGDSASYTGFKGSY